MNEIIKSAINRVKLNGENIWTRYSYWTKAKDVELENGENAEDKMMTNAENLLNHELNKSNPHNVTKAQLGLENVDNTKDEDKIVSTQQREAIDMSYQQATEYTDKKIADLIGGAPTTLDTLGEVAKAMQESEDVVDALHESIGSKAAQAELDGHINNNTIHITAAEREKWNTQSDCAEIIGYTNINGIGDGTLTGAISSLNENKAHSGHTHAISNVNGLQSALDNKVTTGSQAKLYNVNLGNSNVALVYSEEDNVNFRFKGKNGDTLYTNLKTITGDINVLADRGRGYFEICSLWSNNNGATLTKPVDNILGYSSLLFCFIYGNKYYDTKLIPAKLFTQVMNFTGALRLHKANGEDVAAEVWWDGSQICTYINTGSHVVRVYGIA